MEGWERIKKILEREGLTKNSLSARMGLGNNVTITRIINEHRTPSRATCERIVKALPWYNLKWVLTGEGEMLNETNETTNVTQEELPRHDDMLEMIHKLMERAERDAETINNLVETARIEALAHERDSQTIDTLVRMLDGEISVKKSG